MAEALALSGQISMGNAPEILRRGSEFLEAHGGVIDFAAVERVDSSVISLMLEWRRIANSLNRPLEFHNLRCNIRALADMYGVSEFLPLPPGGNDCIKVTAPDGA